MTGAGTVLIVDDNAQSRGLAGDVLKHAGYRVLLAESGEQCLRLARDERPDVIVLDRVMPGMSGDEVTGALRGDKALAGIKIIMLSAKTSADDKAEGLDLGADDYLAKPYERRELTARVDVHCRTKKAEDALQQAYADVESKVQERTRELSRTNERLEKEVEQRERAERALREALAEVEQLKNRYQAESIYLKDEIRHEHNFEQIVGSGKPLEKLMTEVGQVAPTNASVLILGESGTGKELVARAVHNLSRRAERPLVKVNCAALPENLIESELFGHEKGAFTGALARKMGRFELADGGTIFLDEIGELPLDLQSKLLRVLQEGEFERLGNSRTERVDVRVIAASNRNLEAATKAGEFREDLYYRLNVFPIVCPPLRDRKGDIPVLAQHFLIRYCAKIGRKIDKFSDAAMAALQAYSWPGNVRELENVIERAVILSVGPVLELDERFGRSPESSASAGEPTSMQAAEADFIRAALEACNWVVEGEGGAAARLELQPSTLRSRMKKYGIRNPAKT